MDRTRTKILCANHMIEKKAVYIAMCTRLKISSPGGVCGADIQVIFHQSDGRGHDADKLEHVVQTCV